MTFEQAAKHLAKVFKYDPMRLSQFENDMIDIFCDSQPFDGEPNFVSKLAVRKGNKTKVFQLTTNYQYKTQWHTSKMACLMEAATVYCHNNLKAFNELYDYPEEEAKKIIAEGFKD